MGEMKGTKLHHILKIAWESEEMPGWGDTLSTLLEATKKEFHLNGKEDVQKISEMARVERSEPELEEDFSM